MRPVTRHIGRFDFFYVEYRVATLIQPLASDEMRVVAQGLLIAGAKLRIPPSNASEELREAYTARLRQTAYNLSAEPDEGLRTKAILEVLEDFWWVAATANRLENEYLKDEID